MEALVLVLGALAMTVIALEPSTAARAIQRLRRLLVLEHGFLFQRISRTAPEKMFIIVKNNWSTAAIVAGQVVQWDYSVAADGISVTQPHARATSAGFACAGVIADQTIAYQAYGLSQVWGFNAAARVREMTGGTVEPVPGRPLAMNAAGGAWCLESMATAAGAMVFPCAFMLSATASFTTGAKAVFVKAM
jgi:hypothetical protein